MSKKEKFPGIDIAADILQALDPKTRERILNDISKKDPLLVNKLNHKIFTFEHLIIIEPKDLPLLLTLIPREKFALCFKNASEPIKKYFFSNIPQRAANVFSEEIQALGPRKLSDVENAKNDVSQIILKLIRDKKINIKNQ